MSVSTDTERIFRIGGYVKRAKLNLRNEREIRAFHRNAIVCGHWHTSYGHSKYERKGTEFGEDADFSPYYGPGIIAIDACTAFSGKVNCLVIED